MAGLRRGRLRLGFAVMASAAVVASVGLQPADASPSGRADLILFNGRIVTVDKAFDVAQAVAVKGGRISAVGTDREVMAQLGPDTKTVDLHGREVIPGLNDSHYHQTGAAIDATRVQLIGARSVQDVMDAIAQRVAQTPAGDWVQASSEWHESLLAEGRLPTRQDLDPVSPDNPVYIPRGGHTATVNSLALKLAGITAQTPDPPNGHIVRDANGEPTGVLFDAAKNLVAKLLPPDPTGADLEALLQAQSARDLSMGITGLTNPSVTDSDIQAYQDMSAKGELKQRVHLLHTANSLQDVDDVLAKWHKGALGDRLFLDGFGELTMDGGVETAYMTKPYQIVPGEQLDPNFHGTLILPPGGLPEKLQMLQAAAKAGWQVGIHAVGDATNEMVVSLYEQVNATTPISKLRWNVMHGFLLNGDQMDRMRKMNVAVTVQDHPTLLGFNMIQWWGKQRAAASYPLKQELRKGILIAGGTDAPVVPLDPFLSISWMVTRDTLTAGVIGPSQAITRQQALRAYTMGSAYTQFADESVGSLEVGKQADMVILSQDLLQVPADKIADTTALATFVGGQMVYSDADRVVSKGDAGWQLRA
jgi:predicted amidohydrolase YtcJ